MFDRQPLQRPAKKKELGQMGVLRVLHNHWITQNSRTALEPQSALEHYKAVSRWVQRGLWVVTRANFQMAVTFNGRYLCATPK
jgi:hypothetical protein